MTPLAASFFLQFLQKQQQNPINKKQVNKTKTSQNHETKVNHARNKTPTSARRSSAIFRASALPNSTQKELMKFWIDLRKLGEVTLRLDGSPSFSL
jgi:hypothetical protein